MNREMIKRLKTNERGFFALSQEEQAFLRENIENVQLRTSIGWCKKTCRTFANTNTYRLSEDFELPLFHPIGCDLLDPKKCGPSSAACVVPRSYGNPRCEEKCEGIDCHLCIACSLNSDALKRWISEHGGQYKTERTYWFHLNSAIANFTEPSGQQAAQNKQFKLALYVEISKEEFDYVARRPVGHTLKKVETGDSGIDRGGRKTKGLFFIGCESFLFGYRWIEVKPEPRFAEAPILVKEGRYYADLTGLKLDRHSAHVRLSRLPDYVGFAGIKFRRQDGTTSAIWTPFLTDNTFDNKVLVPILARFKL